jgi:hypothetical protein
MSPLRYPAKAKAPRSLIAVSIRLVQRHPPGPGVARELQFKSHFKGEAKCGVSGELPRCWIYRQQPRRLFQFRR